MKWAIRDQISLLALWLIILKEIILKIINLDSRIKIFRVGITVGCKIRVLMLVCHQIKISIQVLIHRIWGRGRILARANFSHLMLLINSRLTITVSIRVEDEKYIKIIYNIFSRFCIYHYILIKIQEKYMFLILIIAI